MAADRTIFSESIKTEYYNLLFRYKQIMIDLYDNVIYNKVTDELMKKIETINIFNKILLPSIIKSKECYLYHDRVYDKFTKYLDLFGNKRRGKFELNVNDLSAFDDIDFWIDKRKGSIVWVNQLHIQDMINIMKRSYNPAILSNPGAVGAKSAVQFCKSRGKKDNSLICFCLLAGTGFDFFLIFPPEERLKEIMDLAFKYCNLTPGYVRMHLG